MTLYGPRRGEVMGLCWSDLDLDGQRAEQLGFEPAAPTLTVAKTRVSVADQLVEEDPKTERSARTLPLDEEQFNSISPIHHSRSDRVSR